MADSAQLPLSNSQTINISCSKANYTLEFSNKKSNEEFETKFLRILNNGKDFKGTQDFVNTNKAVMNFSSIDYVLSALCYQNHVVVPFLIYEPVEKSNKLLILEISKKQIKIKIHESDSEAYKAITPN